MIRYSYVIPRMLIILIIYLFFYLFFDKLLEFGIEKSLESLFNAKVDIYRLKTSFLKGTFIIDRMEVGSSSDEFKNLFQFEKLTIKLNVKQLFKKKFIIEEAKINGLLFSGKRKTSAKINKKKSAFDKYILRYSNIAKDFLIERIEDIKTQGLGKLDVEIKNLETIKLIDEIKIKKISQYQKIYSDIESLNIDLKIKKFEEDISLIKSEKNFMKQIKYASQLKKDFDDFYKIVKEKQKEISLELKNIKNYISEINEAKKRDIVKITSLLEIPTLDKDNISRFLFGKKVYENFEKYSFYFNKAKEFTKYLPEKPKKKIFEEKKERGRYIHYILKENYPTFLLTECIIDGRLTPENPKEYIGIIRNLSSNPHLYPKPLIVNVKAKENKAGFYIDLNVNLSTQPIDGNMYFNYYGFKLSDIKFGDDKFSFELKNVMLDFELRGKFKEDLINFPFMLKFYNFVPTSSVNISSQKNFNIAIERVLNSLKSFNINGEISGELLKPSVKIGSDVGDIIFNEIKNSFNKELENIKLQINEKINSEIDKKIKELDNLIKENEGKILQKINLERIDLIKEKIEQSIKNKIKL
ncbi:MAG: TIGR03545 family protein [Elusimicrobiales bacterium]|nr:TIGR03545 family protein [Elusimicrobiales bacterium]